MLCHFRAKQAGVTDIYSSYFQPSAQQNMYLKLPTTLFRKKRFEINFFVRQNASNFAILIEKENPPSFFRVLFRAT